MRIPEYKTKSAELILAIAAIYCISALDCCSAPTIRIDFEPELIKIIGDSPPVEAKLVYEKGGMYVRIKNASKSPIAIMKHPWHWTQKSMSDKGIMIAESLSACPVDKEEMAHIILPPKASVIVAKLTPSEPEALAYRYEAAFGCLAPPAVKYLEFLVIVDFTQSEFLEAGKNDVETGVRPN